MSGNDSDLVDRMAKKHSVSPAAVQDALAALRAEAAGWPSSATPTSEGCRSGRQACRWSATCSTPLKAKLDAFCTDIAAHLMRRKPPMGHALTLTFTSQDGLVRIADLPKISV
jgi:hypothetical protein